MIEGITFDNDKFGELKFQSDSPKAVYHCYVTSGGICKCYSDNDVINCITNTMLSVNYKINCLELKNRKHLEDQVNNIQKLILE